MNPVFETTARVRNERIILTGMNDWDRGCYVETYITVPNSIESTAATLMVNEAIARAMKPGDTLKIRIELVPETPQEHPHVMPAPPNHGSFPVCDGCDTPIDASGFCSLTCPGGDAVMTPCTCLQCEAHRQLFPNGPIKSKTAL